MNVKNALPRLVLWRRRSKLHRMSPFEKFAVFLLVLLSIFMLMPLIYIFNHSLKPYSELFIYPPNIFVRDASFQNFVELLAITKGTATPMSRYIFNSVVVAILCVIIVTIVSAMCAYPISKHKFPGHKIVFGTIILTLLFAPETVAIPRYLIVSKLGIMNTYLGHIMPMVAVPTGVFLMKQFIDQIPNELLDSAKMDGAREYTIFMKIVIPVIMPAVATIGIIAFNAAWGNTETSTLFMQDEEMKTFPFFISTLTSGMANNVARQGAAAAAALLMFLPNLIIFLLFQSKVIATMAHSGIK
ncbi:carbohydrate ABC transporter permease [Paenibacillus ginsengihumi]|jgi:ABC-type glycerol-3-phosphate transport system permease component|uniref:carbohydrate ABC transporter permease n=1 Tax=Paenibacillus ginsengihumi TaxID=431596 RepID=UPI00036E3985|nr:carbohydrate ABC transporter permease [Paenibacillus ginsengihumi]